MPIILTTVLGCYVFEKDRILEKIEFNRNQSIRYCKQLSQGKEIEPETNLMKKHDARKANKGEWYRLISMADDDSYRKSLRQVSMRLVGDELRHSITKDHMIMNAMNNIDELDKVANALAKRIREWYSPYFPEATHLIPDQTGLIKAISKKSKDKLMKELKVKESIGSEYGKQDLEAIMGLVNLVLNIFNERDMVEAYLSKVMGEHCPNLNAVAGSQIGARLLREAGSLERLAMMTSTTIQMLGAEKALFRHLKNKKSRPPKHGHIINHPAVTQAKKDDKGRMARMVADKISMAVRVDYFKGEYLGEKMRKELDAKASGNSKASGDGKASGNSKASGNLPRKKQ